MIMIGNNTAHNGSFTNPFSNLKNYLRGSLEKFDLINRA